MEARARVTSKGQVTIPKVVREALQLAEGELVVFRIEAERVVVTAAPDFFALAGSVPVPPEVRGMSWDEIRAQAWLAGWEDSEDHA